MNDLADSDWWKDLAAAAAAAERALVIVDLAASTRTRQTSRAILDHLWAVADGSASRGPLKFADQIMRFSEVKVDNSDRREWFAASALGVLHAAASLIAEGSEGNADEFADVAADAYGEVDGVVDYATPRIIDPRNPPPPGRLEVAEARHQEEDRETLRRSTQRAETVRELRERARAQRVEMREAVLSNLGSILR